MVEKQFLCVFGVLVPHLQKCVVCLSSGVYVRYSVCVLNSELQLPTSLIYRSDIRVGDRRRTCLCVRNVVDTPYINHIHF